MRHYEQVTQKFQKFFDQDFLDQIIEGKLDVTEVAKIKQDFLTIEEFTKMIDFIKTMSVHLQTISSI